jgi:hypothetical protein
MSIIPIHILLPVCAVVLLLLAFGIEASCYLAFLSWYYRSGPAICRERWQTSGTVDGVRSAIRPWLRADGLVGWEAPEGICIRQKIISFNTWSRVFLRIERAERGAALHFEVRPFYTMALLMLPAVWLAIEIFGLTGPMPYLAAVLLFVVIGVILMYRFLTPFDLRRINRLSSIRRALAPFGLRICEHCGYDLFGHESPQRCPECGRTCGDH